MKVSVVIMVITVVLSTSTLEYCEAIASEELCEQIRSNQRDILTMGVRGRSYEDAHFYILTTGGYMFKVPLSNLRVNAALKTTSVTIDREHILADFLLEESRDQFTRKARFFLISNPKQDTFLVRLEPYSKGNRLTSIQLYMLDGARSRLPQPKTIPGSIHVMASVGIDSNIAYGCELVSNRLLPRFTFELNNQGGLYVSHYLDQEKLMLFSGTADIVTAFYHQENAKKEDGYYYFLDHKGLLTVSPRKSASDFATSEEKFQDLYTNRFEVNLSSFVVCHFKQTKQTTDPPTNGWTYWIIALCGVTLAALGGLAFYLYRDWKNKKVKERDSKQKDGQDPERSSNLSSNVASNLGSKANSKANSKTSTKASSSPTTSFMTNKVSSALQSVKSTINSLLTRNQTKQAKTVAKVKKPKMKTKKPKSQK